VKTLAESQETGTGKRFEVVLLALIVTSEHTGLWLFLSLNSLSVSFPSYRVVLRLE
jgi:hypothetical protein